MCPVRDMRQVGAPMMGLRGILEVLTTRVAPGKAKGAMTGTVFAVYLGERDHWVSAGTLLGEPPAPVT